MRKIRRSMFARVLEGACASAVIVGLTVTLPASGATASPRGSKVPAPSHCHPAQLAGSGGFLGGFTTVCEIASTVPANGDVNPYGVAVVPKSTGDLTARDVLVSNFNNSHNLQGTGTTIMEISPSGKSAVFANLARQTKDHLGLTTALAVFGDGYVVVGSLPTTDGTAKTARAGAL